MTNRLKSYVRRTIIAAAKECAYPKARRTPESTRSALMDATRGTDTGWWSDLIRTAPALAMAHKHRADIAEALAAWRDATGEEYVYRPGYGEPDISEAAILSALLKDRKPYTLAEYHDTPEAGAALTGLRFAVEWYAGEVAHELCPDF